MIRAILVVSLMGALVACSSHPTQADDRSGLRGARATFSGSEGAVRTSLLKVADSDDERVRGLKGRTSLPKDGGMVFVFDGPTDASFWMKDTPIPLSIAFWGADDRILDILEMEPCVNDPCPTYRPGEAYTHALEMNRGWFTRRGVEIGDSVELDLLAE